MRDRADQRDGGASALADGRPTMWRSAGRIALRHALAAVAALVAWRITLVIWPWVKPNMGPVFFVTMIATAWFWGLGPALTSTAVALVCMAYLIPSHAEPAGFYAGDVARIATFVMTAVMITWLNKSRKRAQAALSESWRLQGYLEEQRQRLETTNERLRQEVAERERAQGETLAQQGALRKMAAELSMTEERERREIASQLHDGVGQLLAFSQMRLESVLAAVTEPKTRGALDEAVAQLKEAIGQTRSLTRELSPPVLYEAGLEKSMEWLADNVQRRHGLPVSVSLHGAEPVDGIGRELRVFLFQAVRELLTNVVKHGKARQADVTLFLRDAGSIRVVVEDDGQGMIPDLETLRDGFGLLNIRERAKHLGGDVEVENDPGRGARVTVTVPITTGDSANAA